MYRMFKRCRKKKKKTQTRLWKNQGPDSSFEHLLACISKAVLYMKYKGKELSSKASQVLKSLGQGKVASSCHPKQVYTSKHLCRLIPINKCVSLNPHIFDDFSLISHWLSFLCPFDCVWFVSAVWFLKESTVDWALSSSLSLRALCHQTRALSTSPPPPSR